MNGQEIINIFRRYVGDEGVDDDLALDLLNTVKDMVEGDRPWRMLVKEDSSQTFGASDTYLTSKDLPDDFFSDIKLKLGTESSDDYIEYDSCELEERRRFSASQRYCIDLAGEVFYVLGSVSQTYTIYLYYIKETPAITLITSPVWPTKFQRLIPLLMAEIHKGGVDADTWNLEQALRLSKPGLILWKAMQNWDSVLKLKSMGGRTPIRGTRTGRATSGRVSDPDGLLG